MDWQNQPSWSPAGDKLVFSWNKHPLPPDHNPLIDAFPLAWKAKETIYIVNRDGTDLKQLVDEAGPAAHGLRYVIAKWRGTPIYTGMLTSFMQIFKLDINSGDSDAVDTYWSNGILAEIGSIRRMRCPFHPNHSC